MTLGAGALARPLVISHPTTLHWPWLAMIASLGLVIALAAPRGELRRPAGAFLVLLYPAFVVGALLIGGGA